MRTNHGRSLGPWLVGFVAFGALAATAKSAEANTYQVGPGKAYANLGAVANLLAPGDVVEVTGDATYPSVKFTKAGTAAQKITIKGIRVNGKRPVLSGGTNTIELAGNHYVFEGFEVTGGSSRCVYHHADDITVRDSAVHDCPNHGILGADSDSGSLTLDYVEVYRAGSGDTHHPIYIATDESAYPGSVFRMQHCYVHDGNGGNNVKTRAERNEIYYNWIEGATYHEIELIGPDGQDPGLAREDSDVVGNVFRKTKATFVARIGGDGTGDTNGRYRFVNNTFLLAQGSSAAFRLFDGVESLELHNNVFYRVGGGGVQIINDSNVSWSTGSAIIGGSDNWIAQGSTSVPGGLTGTLTGTDPGFMAVDSFDLRPASGSVLVDAGDMTTQSPAGHAFPSPLGLPAWLPPDAAIEAVGAALARVDSGPVDIGAYAAPTPPGGGSGGAGGGTTTGSGAGGSSGVGGADGAGGSAGVGGAGGAGTTTTGAGGNGGGAGGAGQGGATATSGAGGAASTASGSGGSGAGSETKGDTTGDSEESGGCSVGGVGHGAGDAGATLALVGIAWLGARRRRRS